MWSGHVVWDKTGGTRYAHRPGAGRLALSFETSRPLDAPDRCVVDPAFVRGVQLRVAELDRETSGRRRPMGGPRGRCHLCGAPGRSRNQGLVVMHLL